jgi:hypothetical protein
VNDDKIDPQDSSPVADLDYEPPAVVDLGTVFDVTQGNASGSQDEGDQRS